MYIAAQGPRLRNDLYCVEWDVKLYYTILGVTIAVNWSEVSLFILHVLLAGEKLGKTVRSLENTCHT